MSWTSRAFSPNTWESLGRLFPLISFFHLDFHSEEQSGFPTCTSCTPTPGASLFPGDSLKTHVLPGDPASPEGITHLCGPDMSSMLIKMDSNYGPAAKREPRQMSKIL